MSFLNIQDLNSGYGKTVIVRDVNLTIEHGKVLCILGRNGVGKTTFLKTIMGVVSPMSGDIFIGNEKVTKLKPYQIANKNVAYASQESPLFQDLTVEENLKIGMKKEYKNFIKDSQDVFELFPKIRERFKQKAGTLSGGEQKMLLMTRALIRRPKLLILDEITEGVQPSIINNIAEGIKWINKELDTTILLVEQNVDFALNVSNSFAVMNQGEIKVKGAVEKSTKSMVERFIAV